MEPLRIAITVPWARRAGGAENILWTFLSHVDRQRIDPLVVFFEDGPWEREAEATGIRTAVIPTGRLRDPFTALAAIWKLRRLLRAERSVLLLDWSPKAHLYGAPAATLAGLR